MIINCFERHGLEYRINLDGQGYDGAAVMSGKHSVCTRIQDVAKYAFYVHCNAHCLNVVIVDSVKSVSEADCFFLIKNFTVSCLDHMCTPNGLKFREKCMVASLVKFLD